jgi:putative heme-binding domain-containing protein
MAAVGAAQSGRQNPLADDPKAAEEGRIMFRSSCSLCHGIKGEGGRGPDLTLGSFAVGDSDEEVFRVIASGAAGTEMPGFGGRYESDDIWRIVAYLRSLNSGREVRITGNRDAGERLFWEKGQCGQCHMVEGRGKRMGPDLSRVGRQRSLAYLRESVVDPNADLTPGFPSITVVTKQGKKIVGAQRGIDDFSVQLMDAGENYYSFLRSDLASVNREYRSLMPDTYGKLFNESELNDLVAYMASLRGGRELKR